MRGGGGNGAILAGAMKDLMVHWDHTASTWKDAARSGFEKDFLQELIPAVRAASNAVQQIEELLRQAQRECS